MDEPVNSPEVPPATTDTPPAALMADRDAQQWAMFCHLAGLAKYVPIPLSNILAPIILWQIKKDQSPFVDDQGKRP